MSKSYIAKFQGKVVGKRTSKDRTYTHAIVIIASRENQRKVAYGYAATATDRSNYDYYLRIAEGRIQPPRSQDETIKASIKVDGGFDAYVERERQRHIAIFEDKLANGNAFEPFVVSWAGRPDLALRAAAQYRQPWNDVVEIVPAELVVKKAKVT